ncbi:DUF1810 domain-containing protein [Rhizobium rhizoryzae]|jgi:uncharacterized protein (DUF1810 family)|uniref:Uncharacterized protein (DUF1810 family) n=1 Tax=Rhizobium rhizoryzae TaxID=451876 RepID=A0A7W6LGP4_9HYPH|nr:DUF1810 domain-containing protein [Rhizobium rhizoryzae]MBB4143837.1 uncharacterized protein (DUF1810 family) [Rhizobium rhizoryzae]
MSSHDLQRFLDAQQPVYTDALEELRAGRKRSHWMWFIFPQIEGLGRSETARFYALANMDAAKAYLGHPTLGQRLLDCTNTMLTHKRRTAHDILGSPDDLKFRSSMTLFMAASEKGSPFERALQQFYGGEPDQATLSRL